MPYFYAVAKGRKPGIYLEWSECKAQILNYNGAKYKKFPDLSETESWIRSNLDSDTAADVIEIFLSSNPAIGNIAAPTRPALTTSEVQVAFPAASSTSGHASSKISSHETPMPQVSDLTSSTTSMWKPPAEGKPWIAYSDGSCRSNGNSGATAGALMGPPNRNIAERCPGRPTNNRAELITDSEHTINCWKQNGWRTATGKPVSNIPLLKYADVLLQERREFYQQPVTLVKVLAHAGEEGNEGADQLANVGATMPVVPDSDWEELILRTQARMTSVTPTSNTINMKAAPSTASFTSRPSSAAFASQDSQSSTSRSMAPVHLHSIALLSTQAVPISTDVGQTTGSQSEKPAMVPIQAISPPLVTQRHVSDARMIYGDPYHSMTPDELEFYAECVLSDDEFMREAHEMGL
ncbi:hypothetical protein BC628DRAFT_1338433 [Trametes gibbosa]|nr:hypothetical protein BC628DRAFT_1338433 [Trametes gibbosa]